MPVYSNIPKSSAPTYASQNQSTNTVAAVYGSAIYGTDVYGSSTSGPTYTKQSKNSASYLTQNQS